jgi:glyoxylate reductase
MDNPRIVLTRRIPEPGLRLLRDAGASVLVIQHDDEAPVDTGDLHSAATDADVLITLLTEPIDATLLEACTRLRGIAQFAVGYNNIDVAAATSLGIPVTNTPGVLTETTADLTWALLLGAARRIVEAHEYMASGRFRIWGPQLLLGADVGTGADGAPRTLGIIGYGRIGRAVARRARGFDMHVIAYGPHFAGDDDVEAVTLEELLARSDFVTLHAALNASSRHMIGMRELQLMKSSAYLINVARGELIDETALVHALRTGVIAGAALDVYEHEPAMAPGLADCPNALLVPHIGSATVATRAKMAVMAATGALAHARLERASNCINMDVYDSAAYSARIRLSE